MKNKDKIQNPACVIASFFLRECSLWNYFVLQQGIQQEMGVAHSPAR